MESIYSVSHSRRGSRPPSILSEGPYNNTLNSRYSLQISHQPNNSSTLNSRQSYQISNHPNSDGPYSTLNPKPSNPRDREFYSIQPTKASKFKEFDSILPTDQEIINSTKNSNTLPKSNSIYQQYQQSPKRPRAATALARDTELEKQVK